LKAFLVLLLPFHELPVADPGTPDRRSPFRYLVWLAREQLGTLSLAMLFGVGWMVSQALFPVAVGAAIRYALKPRSTGQLFLWSFVVLFLGLVQAISGVYRHQLAVTNWMKGTYRSIQVVGRHLSENGLSVTDEIAAGDVVNTVASDAMRIGGAFDVLARFVGAVAAWIVISIYMLNASFSLGLIALIGVPLLASLTTPLMKPLHASQAAQREVAGRLAALGADTVAGLRILRGVGGEEVFFSNYRAQSQRVRKAGNRVASPQAGLESGQVLLPAILTAVITFIGAHDVARGTLRPDQLFTFFGLSMFLTTPVRTSIEYIIATTRAFVGARKVLAILNTTSPMVDPAEPIAWPSSIGEYRDALSGVVVRHGTLCALVTDTPAEAAQIADRLGHFVPDVSGVSIDGAPINHFSIADTRQHIVVSEVEPRLFSGDVRSELAPHGHVSDTDLLSALDAVSGRDILDAIDGGLDAVVEERGRSFSGGQRQRLALARALLIDADFLILVEPTSAVDAHTESRIAKGLSKARAGRTTLVATSSPLMLEQVERIMVISDGCVATEGTHSDLLEHSALYRRLVLRGEEQ
jgi:ABC-type multidrug transport system fused ATPase/permease subunit